MVDQGHPLWDERDLPVLREVTRRIDSGEGATVEEVAAATGLPDDDVRRAGRALERRGLVTTLTASGHHILWFKDISGEAYLKTGLHPDGDDAISRLVEAINQAAQLVDDPDERSALRRFLDAAGGVSRTVLADVLAAVITKGALGA